MNVWNDVNLIEVLKDGGVVVMPTDTVYGIVGRAENISTIRKIYEIRKRTREKPCIILIGNINQLDIFGILLSQEQKNLLLSYWSFDSALDLRPKPVSLIVDGPTKTNELFTELHRGTNTLAFRMPSSKELRDLLIKVGPLIVPSANTEGLPTAQNITEAKKYFGNQVDLYVDGGDVQGKASKVIKLNINGSIEILRP